ncbi:cobalt-precorrin-8X methylmutase [Oscillatoriales cyanobacterium LEGE 11467]|uniref:Cobalt-precorrin-8X methylmutase n=1 Tax=Zarconia navalis LEGE 11467 TaxID=1828826 RepID=A0A928W2B9_9CYAN|nr:cobalt-precorrin-8X methylmutase [Zarconia navalis]MBE9042643.1 cobalt-precorrin-8X methylmutase [Zarconia navalis LEGE 11467]
MSSHLNHPIVRESFAIIDREIGECFLNPAEYEILRRVIHSTADFEFEHLIRFGTGAIERAIAALPSSVPIITDVTMVKQGIATMVSKTFGNPIVCAIDRAPSALPGRTRTETGMLECYEQFPHGIYVIGNAPTALLALCDRLATSSVRPTLVVGAPVGFVSVLESKKALAQTDVPQIRIEGRKGGSPVAAAILNALLVLAWDATEGESQKH